MPYALLGLLATLALLSLGGGILLSIFLTITLPLSFILVIAYKCRVHEVILRQMLRRRITWKLGVESSVESVSCRVLSLQGGDMILMRINNITLQNPEGYSRSRMATIGQVDVLFNGWTFASKCVLVKSLFIENVDVYLERQRGKLNITAVKSRDLNDADAKNFLSLLDSESDSDSDTQAPRPDTSAHGSVALEGGGAAASEGAHEEVEAAVEDAVNPTVNPKKKPLLYSGSRALKGMAAKMKQSLTSTKLNQSTFFDHSQESSWRDDDESYHGHDSCPSKHDDALSTRAQTTVPLISSQPPESSLDGSQEHVDGDDNALTDADAAAQGDVKKEKRLLGGLLKKGLQGVANRVKKNLSKAGPHFADTPNSAPSRNEQNAESHSSKLLDLRGGAQRSGASTNAALAHSVPIIAPLTPCQSGSIGDLAHQADVPSGCQDSREERNLFSGLFRKGKGVAAMCKSLASVGRRHTTAASVASDRESCEEASLPARSPSRDSSACGSSGFPSPERRSTSFEQPNSHPPPNPPDFSLLDIMDVDEAPSRAADDSSGAAVGGEARSSSRTMDQVDNKERKIFKGLLQRGKGVARKGVAALARKLTKREGHRAASVSPGSTGLQRNTCSLVPLDLSEGFDEGGESNGSYHEEHYASLLEQEAEWHQPMEDAAPAQRVGGGVLQSMIRRERLLGGLLQKVQKGKKRVVALANNGKRSVASRIGHKRPNFLSPRRSKTLSSSMRGTVPTKPLADPHSSEDAQDRDLDASNKAWEDVASEEEDLDAEPGAEDRTLKVKLLEIEAEWYSNDASGGQGTFPADQRRGRKGRRIPGLGRLRGMAANLAQKVKAIKARSEPNSPSIRPEPLDPATGPPDGPTQRAWALDESDQPARPRRASEELPLEPHRTNPSWSSSGGALGEGPAERDAGRAQMMMEAPAQQPPALASGARGRLLSQVLRRRRTASPSPTAVPEDRLDAPGLPAAQAQKKGLGNLPRNMVHRLREGMHKEFRWARRSRKRRAPLVRSPPCPLTPPVPVHPFGLGHRAAPASHAILRRLSSRLRE